jgi:hypothetical protein
LKKEQGEKIVYKFDIQNYKQDKIGSNFQNEVVNSIFFTRTFFIKLQQARFNGRHIKRRIP